MKNRKKGHGYNERLFSGGLRTWFHLARFDWLLAELKNRRCSAASIVELGCFDGKLLDFLPQSPLRYVGFDANWEGGLDIAKEKWKSHPNFSFHRVTTPEEMRLEADDTFDVAVAMETLEHVPPPMVDGYLSKIASHLDGYFFVTVPNEKGLVFLSKWLAKKLLRADADRYSFSELMNATAGRMSFVARREHKGFDYARLIGEMERHFDVIAVSGHPFGFLPYPLCFGIGIVAKSRPWTNQANAPAN